MVTISVNDGRSVLVELSPELCFYSKAARDDLAALGQLAASLHDGSRPRIAGILVLQQGDAVDAATAWQEEVEHTALFADLAPRVDTWRWVLSLIRNSPIPWIYAARGDAFGSAFELSLSCQRRLWFATAARVGFPEIAAGAFPPGGVIESLSKRTGRPKERWQARPVLAAAAAFRDGLIDSCCNASDWVPKAKAAFAELLKQDPEAGVRGTRRSRERDHVPLLDEQSRRAAYGQLDALWQQGRSGAKGHQPSVWDYCWQLIHERSRLKEPEDLGRLICLLASRHLLSQSYSAWLAGQIGERQGLLGTRGEVTPLPQVYVDLSEMTPPTEVLIRMLKARIQLVLVAHSGKDLAVGVSLLGNRLERALGAGDAQRLWERGVSWYVAPLPDVLDSDEPVLGRPVDSWLPVAPRGMLVRFTADDRLTLVTWKNGWEGAVTRQFLRVEGNVALARPGVLEWPRPLNGSNALAAGEKALLGTLADDVVETTPSQGQSVVSRLRRSVMVELIQLAGFLGGDLPKLIEGLAASGWGFSGDQDAWDRFLRGPRDLDGSAERGAFDLGSIKHAVAYARRRGLPDPQRESDRPAWAERVRNPAYVSQHVAGFLGLQVLALIKAGDVATPTAADQLAACALGFPAALGTPLLFLRRRGRRRAVYEARQSWPELAALVDAEPVPW